MTVGYPSIDKPWLKYYSREAIEAPLPEGSMWEYLRESCGNRSADVAISYFGRRYTYGSLFEHVLKAAASFRFLGVRERDVVVIALPNIPANVFAMYALNSFGAVAYLVDLRYREDELRRVLNESGASVAVVSDVFIDSALVAVKGTTIRHLVVASPFDGLPFPLAAWMRRKQHVPDRWGDVAVYRWRRFENLGDEKTERHIGSASDAACILRTSGTTGVPKGVMLTNRNFNAMVVQYRHCGLDFEPNDSFLNQVPPFLAYNIVMATHLPLALHMRVVMLPDYRPDRFAANIAKHKPNHVVAGPADWGNFLENRRLVEGRGFSFLKTLASGSDTMRPDRKAAVNELLRSRGCSFNVIEGYGMSEVGSAACTNLPQCDVSGSVGIPLPKTLFCIYDNDGEYELPYGELGEICMSGPTVMASYFGDPEATKGVLRAHEDGRTWVHSGDLGYMDENGRVYLAGRMKRIIVRHDGLKVSPFDVETALLAAEGVAECCVVGAPDEKHGSGQVPVAFIVPENEGAGDRLLRAAKSKCEIALPEKSQPVDYRLVEELPLTSNGKVDYRELERRAAQ